MVFTNPEVFGEMYKLFSFRKESDTTGQSLPRGANVFISGSLQKSHLQIERDLKLTLQCNDLDPGWSASCLQNISVTTIKSPFVLQWWTKPPSLNVLFLFTWVLESVVLTLSFNLPIRYLSIGAHPYKTNPSSMWQPICSEDYNCDASVSHS